VQNGANSMPKHLQAVKQKTAGQVVFRPLRPRDIVPVLRFWRSLDGVFLHRNGEDSASGIAAYLRRNPGFSFVAEHKGRIVGALMAGHDGRRGFIHHLGVASRCRRKGIANKLLGMSLGQFRRAGIRKCVLFVLKDNKKAQSFYWHIGWKNEDAVLLYSKVL
jgi:N-acetylglutamate synthase